MNDQIVNDQDQEQEVTDSTQQEQETTASVEYQYDWVVCEYLPKIYGCLLFLIGFLFFAFIYKVIKNNVGSHFV